MTLLELLNEIKQRHGLSDTEIAATLGVSERTLRRWTRGEAGWPTEAMQRALLGMLKRGDLVTEALDTLFHELVKMSSTAMKSS